MQPEVLTEKSSKPPSCAAHCMRLRQAIVETVRFCVTVGLLGFLIASAVLHDIRRRFSVHGWGIIKDLRRGVLQPSNVQSLEALARDAGYVLEHHRVQTSDGFLLTLHRLRSMNGLSQHNAHVHERKTSAQEQARTEAHAQGKSVLLQHGLFQTCLPFMLNKREGSLAFVLADQGGNTFSRRHVRLDSSHEAFWDWSIDEHARDLAAVVHYIREKNGGSPVSYVGHSQGAAQGLIAFSSMPALQNMVDKFVALSPGCFVNQFESVFLRLLARVSRSHPRLYFIFFGRRAFMPFMEVGVLCNVALFMCVQVVRVLAGVRLFAYFAFCMFNYLFHWGDSYWDRTRKFLYFSQTPAGTSARTVAHWMQHSASGRFAAYDFGEPNLNRKHYQQDTPPDHKLHEIRMPVGVIYGGQDLLLNYDKLIGALPNCVFSLKIPHHSHMDNLHGVDAKDLVYPRILEFLRAVDAQAVRDRADDKDPEPA